MFGKQKNVYQGIVPNSYGNGLFSLCAEENGRKVTYLNYVPEDIADQLMQFGKTHSIPPLSRLERLIDEAQKQAFNGETLTIETPEGNFLSTGYYQTPHSTGYQFIHKEGKNKLPILFVKAPGMIGECSIPIGDRGLLDNTLKEHADVFEEECRKLELGYNRKKIMTQIIGSP